MTLLRVTIPEGKNPGDLFTYTDEDGDEMEVMVPEHLKPGDTYEILIDNGDGEIESVTVELGSHTGVTLNMCTFLDDGDLAEVVEEGDDEEGAEAGATVSITELIAEAEEKIDEDELDGTNFMVWPAGVELAQFIASPIAKPLLQNKKNALELGSGCGVGGMALAAALARGDDPKSTQVTMTDLPIAISLLDANVEENKEAIIADSGLQTKVSTLTWGDDEQIKDIGEQKFDLIIGADLIYNSEPEIISTLSSTMDNLLDPKTGLILFSTRWRKFDEERVFFEEMEKLGYEFVLATSHIESIGGDITATEEEYSSLQKMAGLSWKEYGNKDSPESVNYFSETKVKVGDGMKSLGEIGEADLLEMGDGDFDECEVAHIQIYAGYKKD